MKYNVKTERIGMMGITVANDRKGGVWAEQVNSCAQLPGTLIRIFIPAGAVINLLNLIEIASPSGICLIVRIPLLAGTSGLQGILDTIRSAGGSVEILKG